MNAALLAFGFAVALLVAVGGVPIVRRVAIAHSLLDEPGGRKMHSAPVPRLGGAAMLAAFVAGLLGMLAFAALTGITLDQDGVPALLLGVMAVSALGFIDDLRPLSPPIKLVGQTVIAVVVVALGLRVDAVSMPWGTVGLGLAGAALSVVWLVGVANAINLVDGLDGLATGVGLTALLAFGFMASLLHADGLLAVLAVGVGSACGFLLYNRPPASIMMGDAGSMFLGSLLGGAGILLIRADPPRVPPLALVIVLAVPIADTVFAIARRLLARQSIFAADSRHIHHQLVASGMAPGRVVLILVAVSAGCAVLGVLLTS